MTPRGSQSTGAKPPELPLEVIEIVIDFLDRKSLISCTLVSRQWLPRVRFRLFSHIILSGRSLSAFQALIRKGDPILSYIRVVTLSRIKNEESLQAVKECLPSLKALTTLRFFNCSLKPSSPSMPSLTNIRRLCLHCVESPTFRQLTDVVASFPLLEKLTISYILWQYDDDLNAQWTLAAPPPRLLTLRLGHCTHQSSFIEWLSSSPTIKLKNLVLELSDSSETFAARLYTWQLGSSLEHVTLKPWFKGFFDAFDISQNTSLTALHLILCVEQDADWIVNLLSQILSPVFAEFTLEIWLENTSVLDDASEIDLALSQHRFKALKRVRVLQRVNPYSLDMLKEKFPLSAERGILCNFRGS